MLFHSWLRNLRTVLTARGGNGKTATGFRPRLEVLEDRTLLAAGVGNPLGWWRAEGNANDSAGSNHGTMLAGATFAPGQIGQAFSLDGVDDSVEIPDSAGLTTSSAITVAAWVYADTLEHPPGVDFRMIVSKYNLLQQVSWSLGIRDGRINFVVYQNADGSFAHGRATQNQVAVAGQWQHVVATFDTATQLQRMYVNGAEVPTAFNQGGAVASIADTNTPIRIGSTYNDPFSRGAWDGLIDEVLLYDYALTPAEVQDLYGVTDSTSLSGRVLDDRDNDGVFNGADAGIGGVTLTLFNEADLASPVAVTVTEGDGFYNFTESLAVGSYRIVATQPAGYLDGKETAGSLGGIVENGHDSNVIRGIVVGAGGQQAEGYNFAEIRPSSIQGLVWEDFNDDGKINFSERAIKAVAITLTGTGDRGNPVNLSPMSTDGQGIFEFLNLRPGNYMISEAQPSGFVDGRDSPGTVNGLPIGDATINDQFRQVILPAPGSRGINYNFGERPLADGTVHGGQTATIGFWQNSEGQALIRSLNGSPEATQLGHWLATTFPSMYGAAAGAANNLDGLSNAQVADHFTALFKRAGQNSPGGPPKLDAQVLAVALAVYVTNQNLAGTTAVAYGFEVTAQGVGYATFNVGSNGAAFGVVNNATMTVLDLLQAVNARTRNGLLYDEDGSLTISPLEATLRGMANQVFTAINEQGDI